VTYETINIGQVRNCANSMLTRTITPGSWNDPIHNRLNNNQTMVYSNNTYLITLPNEGYEMVFNNELEPTYCPVEYCGLFEVGCSTTLNAAAAAVFNINSVKPWDLWLSANVEDGITIKYCFKCWGETTAVPGTTGTSNLPSAVYDNLSIRMIRNCRTHIQNVTTMANGILAPIHPGS